MPVALVNTTINIRDNVQGVTQWRVWKNVNGGGFVDTTEIYECPSSPVGEYEIYTFVFQDLLSGYNVGDTVQYRFVPTGYDTDNGSSFDSGIYTLVGSLGNNVAYIKVKCKIGGFF